MTFERFALKFHILNAGFCLPKFPNTKISHFKITFSYIGIIATVYIKMNLQNHKGGARAMDVAKSCKLICFGAMAVAEPYELIWFWAMDVTNSATVPPARLACWVQLFGNLSISPWDLSGRVGPPQVPCILPYTICIRQVAFLRSSSKHIEFARDSAAQGRGGTPQSNLCFTYL